MNTQVNPVAAGALTGGLFKAGAGVRGAALASAIGAGLAAEYREACARWPVRPAAPEAAAPVQTDAPVLLLSGALDPVTPARQAALAAETLPRSASITVPGAAHGTLHVRGARARAQPLHDLKVIWIYAPLTGLRVRGVLHALPAV